MILGAIEAGGTRWTCATAGDDGELTRIETFPTTSPEKTLDRAIEFFARSDRVEALGIGTFGPVDLRPSSPQQGQITRTPKPGWAGTDLLTPLRSALRVPIAVDTDVNAAALGEYLHGSAAGLEVFSYVTVGTGIGAGIAVQGKPLHGLLHPEFGHIRVPHDWELDPFEGACPFHGDCLEGLASGEALRKRWGRPAEELEEDTVWSLEADYLALALLNLTFTLSPQRIVIGGGVLSAPQLLSMIRLRLSNLATGYPGLPELGEEIDDYVVAPQLGDRAAIFGALELARAALTEAVPSGDAGRQS